jgi:predicted RNA-binding protein YlqC (UPF0109 family)
MKDFVEYLVKNLVDDANAVQVDIRDDERGITIEVRVAKPDIGKVVGREGRTVQALRTLVQTIGARQDKRVRLEVLE